MKKKLLVPCIIIAAVLFFPVLFRLLPFKALTEFRNQSYSTRIYDRDGILIQVTALENGSRREFTPVNLIPESLKKEFIRQEDKRFYFHQGVDLIALTGALIQNSKSRRIVRGGSTITMQLAKTINNSSEVTVSRKLKDILTSFRIEAKLTKKQILELYLNTIYMGAGSYGITSGARTYFGKELSQLTPGQMKVLSIIPRNPTFYNPLEHPERFESVSQEAFSAASEAERFFYELNMPHFVNYIKSEKSGLQLKNGNLPYEINSSVSMELYQLAEGYLHQALKEAQGSRISNASLLLVDNSDSSVLAWIGNADFYDIEHSGQIDGVLVKNQPGSSMKPFLYALGLEKGVITPSSILKDIPSQFGSDKLYIPENFNNRFNGPVRTRIALASSLNIPAVSLLDQIGVDTYLKQLFSMDFNSLIENGKEADLGLALGAGEVTLFELVPAFSNFVRDGIYIPLTIQRGQPTVTDQRGQTPHQKKSFQKQVYSTDTARLICSILSDKGARSLGFGYTQTFQTEYPSIFKTGTSNQYQDIVALGATENYTIGVWMGNFAGQTVVGKTGSSLPAWVARNIFDRLEGGKTDYTNLEFPEPEHYHKKEICPVSGLKPGPHCRSSVYEYISDKEIDIYENNLCTWHTQIDSEETIVYPPEYQQWIRLNSVSGIIDYNASELTLMTPKDNSLFYYSSFNSDIQAIPVELTGGYENILAVTYDSNEPFTVNRPFVFTLPVEKGFHTCIFKCGSEQTEISFTVK